MASLLENFWEIPVVLYRAQNGFQEGFIPPQWQSSEPRHFGEGCPNASTKHLVNDSIPSDGAHIGVEQS
jgi:hypothetical protein